MTLDHFICIVVYVHDSAVHVQTLFFLPILFLTFIESILENVNNIVCLSFYLTKATLIFFMTREKIKFKL